MYVAQTRRSRTFTFDHEWACSMAQLAQFSLREEFTLAITSTNRGAPGICSHRIFAFR